jgi:hypothetical protein
LVLVVAPARLFSRRFAYWPICDELLSVSARDDDAGAALAVMHGASSALSVHRRLVE